MVLILIACNVYEYYQNKKRLQQYQHYDQRPPTALDSQKDKPAEIGHGFDDNIGYDGFNESKYTYNAIFGNYVNTDDSKASARPMSGWVAPHI